MPKVTDLTGQRFGKLLILSPEGMDHRGKLWLARCDCGNTCVKPTGDLRRVRRSARSCGCGIHDPRPSVTKHGHASNGRGGHPTRTYYAWVSAKARCHKPTHKAYAHYGARGVEMCARWRESFEAFLADMGECPPDLTLDRIDNSRGYEPGNCRWATVLEQNNNRRSVRMADGVSLKEYARREGVRYTSLLKWVDRGLAPADAAARIRRTATKPLPARHSLLPSTDRAA